MKLSLKIEGSLTFRSLNHLLPQQRYVYHTLSSSLLYFKITNEFLQEKKINFCVCVLCDLILEIELFIFNYKWV